MADDATQLEDELLIMAAQDGRRPAMEYLVKRWQKRLWYHAWRLCGSEQGAWDISQETWLGIIRGLSSLNDPASFRGWAYRIATNRARDWIRKKSKQRTETLVVDPQGRPAAQTTDAGGLDELLALLKLDQRLVLQLYYFDQLSTSEIATALSIPAGTVKSRLYHARLALKTLIEQDSNKEINYER